MAFGYVQTLACMDVAMVTYKRERDRQFSCFFSINILPLQAACLQRFEPTPKHAHKWSVNAQRKRR